MPLVLSRLTLTVLATTASIQIAQSQVVETSDKQDTTGMPHVIFFRPPSIKDHGFRVAVYCDLTKVAELRNNTYFEIALSPGEHVCSTEMLDERRTIGDTENTHKPLEAALDIKPGTKQWVSVRFKTLGAWYTTFKLAPEDPAKAAKEVEKKHTQPIKPEAQIVRSIRRTSPGKN